jgi:hypothetical protein
MIKYKYWRGGRVVEGARLEIVYAGNRIGGSNPPFSATKVARICGLFSYLLTSALISVKIEKYFYK